MNGIYQKNRLPLSPSSPPATNVGLAFKFLFSLFWMRHTVLSLVVAALGRLPIIGTFSKFLLPLTFGFLILFSLPYMLKKIKLIDLFVYLICSATLIASALLFKENSVFITNQASFILFSVFPIYFLGLCYDHKSLKTILFWASLTGVASAYAYQIYLLLIGRTLLTDNMGASYSILPSVLYLLYWAFDQKKLKFWILSALGVILSLSYGTRGPAFIILVYFTICAIYRLLKNKHSRFRFVAILALMLLFFGIVFADAHVKIAILFSDLFDQWGFSTRIFDFFLSGDIVNTTGRDVLYSATIEAILDQPIFGYGLMGDRVLLDGSYVHNIFLEILCHFGVIFGALVLMLFILPPVIAVKRQPNKDYAFFLLMIGCMVFLKLMGSSSYIQEPYLFLLLGMCVHSLREQKSFFKMNGKDKLQ